MRKALITVLLFASIASAQTAIPATDHDGERRGAIVFFIEGGARPAPNLGYEGASPFVMPRVRYFATNRLFIEGGFSYGIDHKIETGDGHTTSGSAAIGLAFADTREIEIEAGVKVTKLTTSRFEKADIGPYLKGRIHLGGGVFFEGAFADASRINYITENLSEFIGGPVNLNKSVSFQAGLIHRIPVTGSVGILSSFSTFLTRYRRSDGDAAAGTSFKAASGFYIVLK